MSPSRRMTGSDPVTSTTVLAEPASVPPSTTMTTASTSDAAAAAASDGVGSVSYTHLTLPTNREV